MKFYTCGLGPKLPSLSEHADTVFVAVCDIQATGFQLWPHWYRKGTLTPSLEVSVYSLLLHLLFQSPRALGSSMNSLNLQGCWKFALCVFQTSLSGHFLHPFLRFMSTSAFICYTLYLRAIGIISSKWGICKLSYSLHWSKETLSGFLFSWGRKTGGFLTTLRPVITSHHFKTSPHFFCTLQKFIFAIFFCFTSATWLLRCLTTSYFSSAVFPYVKMICGTNYLHTIPNSTQSPSGRPRILN